ncbi:L-2-hydroxyglutarate oxidase, partial [Nocardioides dubius]|uniref:L-2-hydroxyglutarate oxidase n=1 Tax=Nocardioides dubius TaxID=317019 RepID=UPI0031D0CB57
DAVVVGAGIVGLAVARELLRRRPGSRIAVLEQEADVAAHQSGHNSGVIHGGIYYQPGSLKARLCVEGARLMYDYCAEHQIPHERSGKLIVARDASELGRLDELERRGIANQVPGLRRIAGAEIAGIEPHAVGAAALHAPNTGIVDYAQVARAIRAELEGEGVVFRFGERVEEVDETGGVRTATARLRADRVVVCAGLWADRLARSSGADANPRIVPFRGAYLRLKHTETPVVRGMIYPVPDPDLPFLGVHLTRHLDGVVSLGPTAMLVGARDAYRLRRVRGRDLAETLGWPGTWRVARRYWRTGVEELATAV